FDATIRQPGLIVHESLVLADREPLPRTVRRSVDESPPAVALQSMLADQARVQLFPGHRLDRVPPDLRDSRHRGEGYRGPDRRIRPFGHSWSHPGRRIG